MSLSDCEKLDRKFIVAGTCGFCGGVRKAVSCFEKCISEADSPVYVLHELVHNNFVTRRMIEQGAIIVDSTSEIPDGAVAIIGAHGVSQAVENSLRERCMVIDATCPRVKALQRLSSQVQPDEQLIMLCKPGHPEAEGVIGYSGTQHIYPVSALSEAVALPVLKKPVLLSQTTVSSGLVQSVIKILTDRYPGIKIPGGICDASSNRQSSAKRLAELCEYVLVVGSPHSSNAVELVNMVTQHGTPACLIEDGRFVNMQELENVSIVGITAGASTPDELIESVKNRLLESGFTDGGKADV